MIHITNKKEKKKSKANTTCTQQVITSESKLSHKSLKQATCSVGVWCCTTQTPQPPQRPARSATIPGQRQHSHLSHPYPSEPPQLCETLRVRGAASLCDSQPAPADLRGFQHSSRVWRRRREGRKPQLSSLNFASSEEVPWAWQRIRNLAEVLPLKCSLPCRCLSLLCTLWAITLYLVYDTLHHQHYIDKDSHLLKPKAEIALCPAEEISPDPLSLLH